MDRPKIARRDRNHAEIVRAYIVAHASVCDVSALPGDKLDLIVGFRGITDRVEIKDPSKPPSARRLTDNEQKTFDTWKGRPPRVVMTTDDVAEHLRDLARESNMIAAARFGWPGAGLR